jgi:hypothetical protein
MFTARVSVSVRYPEGKVKTFKAFRAFAGPNRVTWISLDGMRHYVLLRHGFVVNITNL